MYYYIMEPAGRKTAVWQDKVKSVLGDLGIAGETVFPSPARTIEELTMLGIVKGYSTVVAVGSGKIVNKVVSAIINQKENKDVVLGIIPEDFTSSIAQKINVKDLKEACNALKLRRLEQADACLIEPNKYFLTEAIIDAPKGAETYLSTLEVQARLTFNRISIKPGLKISIFDQSVENSSKNGLLGFLFKKKEEEIYNSFFHSKKLKLETPDQSIPVTVDDEVISKTPMICHNRFKALKIIVGRDTISS